MDAFAAAEFLPVTQAFRGLDHETVLLPVLGRLALILFAARLVATAFRKLGQPSVAGEILAGIALGPSLFGRWFPEAHRRLFFPTFEGIPAELSTTVADGIFQAFAQVGLVLLLFLIGLEFQFHRLKSNLRPALAIFGMGLIAPFVLAFACVPLLHPLLEPHPERGPVPLLGLTLFLATALGIAALPVLGRTFLEMGIQQTRLATVIIAAATVSDVVGWIVLAAVTATVKAQLDIGHTLKLTAFTALFILAMFALVRPLVTRYFRHALAAHNGQMTVHSLAILLVLILLTGIATNRIGILSIFGPFVFGLILSDQTDLRRAARDRLHDFTTAFFLPIFFTYSGLRADVGALAFGTHGPLFAALLIFSIVGKWGGCALVAKWVGLTWREAGIAGASMNVLGLMGLIVINVGYDSGVVPPSLYTLLVLVAVVTTMLLSPAIIRLAGGTELEAAMIRSGYRKR